MATPALRYKHLVWNGAFSTIDVIANIKKFLQHLKSFF